MTMKKVICFHGTDSANAMKIRRDGFNKGTFFAKHLEDAFEFGGMWVFEVCFDEDELPPGCWQFKIRDKRSRSNIVSLSQYAECRTIFENTVLRQMIFESVDGT